MKDSWLGATVIYACQFSLDLGNLLLYIRRFFHELIVQSSFMAIKGLRLFSMEFYVNRIRFRPDVSFLL